MSTTYWCFCILGLAIVIAIGYAIYRYKTSRNNPPPDATIYYQVKDSDGELSVIHDSGKVLSGKQTTGVVFQLLKTEINDGKEKTFSHPVAIYLGRDPKNLRRTITLQKDQVKEDDLCYFIEIKPAANGNIV